MRRGAVLLAAALLGGACGGGEEPRNMTDAEVAAELAKMRIEPGLWELTSEVVDVGGRDLPRELRERMIGPRQRLRHCITPEQASRPSANFLAGREESECVYRDFAVENGRVSGAMTCPGAEAAMRGRFGPRAYDLAMEMTSPMPSGAAMTLEVRAHGRRIGECDGGEAE